MGAQRQRHLVPLDSDVGMVAGALGEVGDGPDIEQGVAEVGALGDRGDGVAVAGPGGDGGELFVCLLYTSPSPRDGLLSRMPSSA